MCHLYLSLVQIHNSGHDLSIYLCKTFMGPNFWQRAVACDRGQIETRLVEMIAVPTGNATSGQSRQPQKGSRKETGESRTHVRNCKNVDMEMHRNTVNGLMFDHL